MHVDILILGAGPAGYAAAITARQNGLSVLLLDSRSTIPVSPGETLHPGTEPLLQKLGVWDAVANEQFHRHQGIWKERDGQRIFSPYGADERGEWLGFQADRRRLLQIMERRAAASGALLQRPIVPSALIFEGMRITGVRAGDSDFRARWVFDATGRTAWLARTLGLNAEHGEAPIRVRFGWLEQEDAFLKGQPLFQEHEQGWNWYAPLGTGKTAWVTMRIATSGAAAEDVHGIDMTWRLYPACAGPGYFLLGDAAALLDPAASNGVLRALLSGILAADLVSRTLKGASPSAAVATYTGWVSGMFHRNAQALNDLYFEQGVLK